MSNSNPPPRPHKGSPPLGRHLSPSSDRLSVQPFSQPVPDRPTITSTTSVPARIYNTITSSSTPSEHSAYPPILSDHSQPAFTHSTSAVMAPSTATARSSALAFELPPTSTPTGRISKAKKGKRVHNCEFPGCGKVFTRAEHKRRHEQNHNPEATYHCGQGGCNKSFHRLDLLQRHQERHELEASGASVTHRRYPSQTSAMSEPPQAMPVTSVASPQLGENVPRTTSGGMSIGSLVHPSSHTHNFGSELPAAFGMQNVPYLQWNTSDDSLYYAPESSPMGGRFNSRQSVSSASSVTGYDVTGSPMVTASMPSHWMPGTAPPNALSSDMFGDEYISSTTAPPMPIPLSDLDGYEWSVIRRELSAVPGLLPNSGGTGVPDTVRWHCLELYWQCFHPTFPIVHRPTFLPAKPSPLLACAMLAIGSFYDTAEDTKDYSLALLGIATKILLGRQNITSRSRIADLQTVVLLEILSTFFARQISVQMSTRFRALFANLNQAQHWLTTSPLAVFRTLKDRYDATELNKAHKFFVEHETRSRILHACTVLDNQQAQLFDQSHTIRRHAGLRVTVTSNNQVYHLPCDDELWDASPVEKWAQLASSHEYAKLSQGKPSSPKNSNDYSFFQSQVISANLDQAVPKTPGSTKIKSFPPMSDAFSNRVFNYHVSEMCKHTPIKSLLIVTGESWILGRKIDKQADYLHAKQELRKWVDSATATRRVNTDSLTAHWHALKILRGLMNTVRSNNVDIGLFGTTYMIHENWVVYLACLVCWAHSLRKNINTHSNQGAEPNGVLHSNTTTLGSNAYPTHTNAPYAATDSTQAALEAESYLMFSETSNPIALRDIGANILSRVHGLIDTVRTEKIHAYNMSGLMDDADRVLSKLAEGKTAITF